MTISIAVLGRPRGSSSWNLTSFDEVKLVSHGVPDKADFEAKKRIAVDSLNSWANAFPEKEFMVSQIDADKCKSVNNHDGFKDARPLR